MTTNPTLLGSTAGVATAMLAVAAHGAAGGGMPTGPASVLLLAIAVGVGIVGAHVPSLPPVVLLGAGQAVTHAALTAVADGHSHTAGPLPMLLAHIVAIVGCAILLTSADRLYGAFGSVLRIVTVHLPGVEAPTVLAPTTTTDRLVWGRAPPAISPRGPPVATSAS